MGHRLDFGTVDGKKIELCVIRSGKYVAAVSTYGAALVWYGTKERNYVTFHNSGNDYVGDDSYMGKTIGPYANRIKGASFSLNGKRYTLEKNDGENSLHSGSACWGNRLWKVSGEGNHMVTLMMEGEEGGGFPGLREAEVSFFLSQEGILTISYRASCSEKCPAALTNHAYFVLDDRDSREVKLRIPSEKYIAVGEDLIPQEENPVSVENTPFDFREKTRIGDRRDGRYDNTWVLERNVMVEAEGNLATLLVRTTEPGIQVYTGEFLSSKDASPFQGLALETGRYPDTPNRPDFPQAFIEKDKIFESITSYALIEKE